MRVLPMLFNTEMIQAILDDRKTCTRRIIKKDKIDAVLGSPCRKDNPNIPDKNFIEKLIIPPCQKGDILYVRETYCPNYFDSNTLYDNKHGYKADYTTDVSDTVPEPKWTPSIHMPKAAARIWLKVTDVRVEQLQDINPEGVRKEGFHLLFTPKEIKSQYDKIGAIYYYEKARKEFYKIWDSTINKKQLDIYGWSANPYVFVIEFERCEKPEEANNDEPGSD